LLRVVGVKKNYATPQGALEILRGVDFSLEAGASLALMGESGSGKSTLLHLVGALDQADAGDIFLDDMSLATLGERARAHAERREKLLAQNLAGMDRWVYRARHVKAPLAKRRWRRATTNLILLPALSARQSRSL